MLEIYDSDDVWECFAKGCKHRGPARLSNRTPFAQCGACGSAEVAPLNFEPPEPAIGSYSYMQQFMDGRGAKPR